MKLSDLAHIILTAPPRVPISLQELYDCLDFKGPLNGHLAIPKDHRAESYYIQRPLPLSGDEDVRGELLVFDYVDHKNWMRITEFDTLSQVEEFILGDAGIFNVWTTAVVVIHHSHLLSYRVNFAEAGGSRVVFDPEQHRNLEQEYHEPKIEWIRA